MLVVGRQDEENDARILEAFLEHFFDGCDTGGSDKVVLSLRAEIDKLNARKIFGNLHPVCLTHTHEAFEDLLEFGACFGGKIVLINEGSEIEIR
jgi:hypothetical protein